MLVAGVFLIWQLLYAVAGEALRSPYRSRSAFTIRFALGFNRLGNDVMEPVLVAVYSVDEPMPASTKRLPGTPCRGAGWQSFVVRTQ